MAAPVESKRRLAGSFVLSDPVVPGEIAISGRRITGLVVGDVR